MSCSWEALRDRCLEYQVYQQRLTIVEWIFIAESVYLNLNCFPLVKPTVLQFKPCWRWHKYSIFLQVLSQELIQDILRRSQLSEFLDLVSSKSARGFFDNECIINGSGKDNGFQQILLQTTLLDYLLKSLAVGQVGLTPVSGYSVAFASPRSAYIAHHLCKD